ncbi:MAG: Fe-S cluster assembly protein SufD [Burkholderiales bacterium]|nr:Fe-S cluster assembly protein SufD [Burkholderiales bacterium]
MRRSRRCGKLSVNAIERYSADFARIENALPGSSIGWLQDARRDALSRFAERGIPTTRDENWKYTDVSSLEKRALIAAPSPDRADAATLAASIERLALAAEYHLLVFVDGRYDRDLSWLGRLPAGATISSMAEVLERDPGLLEAHFAGEIWPHGAFGWLNTALAADGAVIHLEADTVVEQPVHLLFLATGSASAVHATNLIVAGNNAKVTVIEHYAGDDGATYFTNALTHIVIGENANVAHYKLQQESAKAFHIAGIHAKQAAHGRFASHSISLGAQLARNDISTYLAAGSHCELNGLYLADGRRHVDHHTRIDHAEPDATSSEVYRGILDGGARGVFNGKVVVHQDAQHTDAKQENHNLLLSKNAEIDTKPELEIYADDVKCTHGATIGQLDDAMLFYLRSRGLDEAAARSLLIYAFAHDIIDRMALQPLRKRLERQLIERLPLGSTEVSFSELLLDGQSGTGQ